MTVNSYFRDRWVAAPFENGSRPHTNRSGTGLGPLRELASMSVRVTGGTVSLQVVYGRPGSGSPEPSWGKGPRRDLNKGSPVPGVAKVSRRIAPLSGSSVWNRSTSDSWFECPGFGCPAACHQLRRLTRSSLAPTRVLCRCEPEQAGEGVSSPTIIPTCSQAARLALGRMSVGARLLFQNHYFKGGRRVKVPRPCLKVSFEKNLTPSIDLGRRAGFRRVL